MSTLERFQLKDKVAIITGGAGLLGRMHAESIIEAGGIAILLDISKEALEVFKDNAETLREAFIKSGFENASINISFADNGSFGNETQNYEEFTKEHQKFAVNKTYGGVVDSEIFEESEKIENFSNNSVNIVA